MGNSAANRVGIEEAPISLRKGLVELSINLIRLLGRKVRVLLLLGTGRTSLSRREGK
jgi:hypothetical protein